MTEKLVTWWDKFLQNNHPQRGSTVIQIDTKYLPDIKLKLRLYDLKLENEIKKRKQLEQQIKDIYEGLSEQNKGG